MECLVDTEHDRGSRNVNSPALLADSEFNSATSGGQNGRRVSIFAGRRVFGSLTDKDGNAFTGTLIIHLFEDLAPQTSARIEQLATQGYYNGLDFFRVIDGLMAQGGRTND
jgi:hypothetical protein